VLADFYDRWDVDLHAVSCMVGADGCLTSRHYPGPSVTAGLIRDFLEDPPIDGDGEPLRIDLISVYDLARLEPVRVVYDDGIEDEPTAFRFVDAIAAATSAPAVLAIDYISGRRSRSPAPPLPRRARSTRSIAGKLAPVRREVWSATVVTTRRPRFHRPGEHT